MMIARRLARPMLASVFIDGGIRTLRDPQPRVKIAEPVASSLADSTPLPNDAEMLVKLNAGVQIGAGTLLALGKLPRLSALALAGSIVPTTIAGHRFWEEEDTAKRSQQRIHFLKNAGLLGGLILAAVDTEGAPSTTWRAKRAVHRLGEAGRPARRDKLIRGRRAEAGRLGASVAGAALSAAAQAGELGRRKAGPAAKVVATRLADEAPRVRVLASRVVEEAGRVAEEAQPLLKEAAERAREAAAQVGQRVREFEVA